RRCGRAGQYVARARQSDRRSTARFGAQTAQPRFVCCHGASAGASAVQDHSQEKSGIMRRSSDVRLIGKLSKAASRHRAKGRAIAAAVMCLLGVLAPSFADAAGIPAVTVTPSANGGQEYSLTLQILILMTAVTLLPGIVLMMTSFTRIVVVLAILRQALGAGQAPPNQVLIGLSLFLTLFVMGPVIDQINTEAVQPYVAGTIDATTALNRSTEPLKRFMLDQTRESDIATFVR